jgi:small subunit ribosomal protein S16
MVKIRLARHGKRNDPFYRIVAIESSKRREGKPLEVLGHWYPKKDQKKIDKKRLGYWVDNGAVVSKAVSNLMKT